MDRNARTKKLRLLSLKRINKMANNQEGKKNEQDLLQLEEKRRIFEALPHKKKYEAILKARRKGEPVYDWMKLPYWNTTTDEQSVALIKEIATTFDFETCEITSFNPNDILNEAATIFCKFYQNTYANEDRATRTVHDVFNTLDILQNSDHPCRGAGNKTYGKYGRSGLDLWLLDLIGIVSDWQDEISEQWVLDDPDMTPEQKAEALRQLQNRDSSIPICNIV